MSVAQKYEINSVFRYFGMYQFVISYCDTEMNLSVKKLPMPPTPNS